MFGNVPEVTEGIKDNGSEIDRALGPLNERGGRNGLVAVLLTPTANVNFENVFGPFFDEIKIVVRVIENVPVNQDPVTGSNIPPAELPERGCALLPHFQPHTSPDPATAHTP